MLLAQHIGVDWRAFDVAAAEFGQPEAPAAFYVPVEEALDNRAEYRLAGEECRGTEVPEAPWSAANACRRWASGPGYLYYNVTDKDVDDGLVFAQVSVPISDWWGRAHALKRPASGSSRPRTIGCRLREMLAVDGSSGRGARSGNPMRRFC